MNKKCLSCGNNITDLRRTKYCSDECSNKYYKNNFIRKCTICGKEFETSRHNKKMCGDIKCFKLNAALLREKYKNKKIKFSDIIKQHKEGKFTQFYFKKTKTKSKQFLLNNDYTKRINLSYGIIYSLKNL